MKIMQVKKYHAEIATKKYERARAEGRGFTRSMYFFMKEDSLGFPTFDRVNGYVAFSDVRAVFAMSADKAILKFNK